LIASEQRAPEPGALFFAVRDFDPAVKFLIVFLALCYLPALPQ
jgi:hypothetical protein